MTVIYRLTDPAPAQPLFAGWEETMLYSCFQGVMGTCYADSLTAPRSAMVVLADFAFAAGTPCRELLEALPGCCGKKFMILTGRTPDWETLTESVFGSRAVRRERYAIRKEPDVFDRAHLLRLVQTLPEGYSCRPLDEDLFRIARENDWSADLVSQYGSFGEFCGKGGLGMMVLRDGEPVSGASAYTCYRGGIEIEIDTRADERRRGLATVCGAALVQACLERGLYPSWDAQNLWSVALAEKLGYHFSHAYPVYELSL